MQTSDYHTIIITPLISLIVQYLYSACIIHKSHKSMMIITSPVFVQLLMPMHAWVNY